MKTQLLKKANKAAKTIAAALLVGCSANIGNAQEVTGYTATQLTEMLGTGWNLGNSLDAVGGKGNGSETSWGNPATTQAMIDSIRKIGFKTIRIPVSWCQHTYDATGGGEIEGYEYKIYPNWMNRVKEVVDYAYHRGMFVIINIHHDNDIEKRDMQYGCFSPQTKYKEESLTYVREIWEQCAEAFAEYDQRLIFETLNEPRVIKNANEWWFWPVDNPNQQIVVTAMDIINQMNQAGVDAVRKNGQGHNKERMILVPGYAACPDGVISSNFVKPTDPSNMIGLEVHAYRPTELCLNGTKTTMTDADCEKVRTEVFEPLSNKWVKNGTPVIIDETSCSNKNNMEARLEWVKCFYGMSKEYNMPCVLWDNNTRVNKSNPGEVHGFFNRQQCHWDEENLPFITELFKTLDLTMWSSSENQLADNVSISIDKENIYVECPDMIENVRIFNTNGQIVDDKEVNSTNAIINITSLKSGFYLAMISTDKGSISKKFVVK
ncbi:MAG: cellulase family glycosylhydrolase [Bacteroidales bacterium]|nr:cellulase family glycosylhydrolase [Candidatus Physcocola equi]